MHGHKDDCDKCRRSDIANTAALSSALTYFLLCWITPASWGGRDAVIALLIGWIPGFFYGRHLYKKKV